MGISNRDARLIIIIFREDRLLLVFLDNPETVFERFVVEDQVDLFVACFFGFLQTAFVAETDFNSFDFRGHFRVVLIPGKRAVHAFGLLRKNQLIVGFRCVLFRLFLKCFHTICTAEVNFATIMLGDEFLLAGFSHHRAGRFESFSKHATFGSCVENLFEFFELLVVFDKLQIGIASKSLSLSIDEACPKTLLQVIKRFFLVFLQ